jgi:hypothetical protein
MYRPRQRWLEDTENDLQELEVSKRRQKANKKEQQTSVVKTVRVLLIGPSSQGMNKKDNYFNLTEILDKN